MMKIKETLELLNYNVDFDEMYGYINANTDTIICMIVAPHEDIDNKYLVRFSSRAAFDRRANSTAIEKFFDTEKEIVDYLKNNQINILNELIDYLSDEYWDLERFNKIEEEMYNEQ
jgi:hypothetical protein